MTHATLLAPPGKK